VIGSVGDGEHANGIHICQFGTTQAMSSFTSIMRRKVEADIIKRYVQMRGAEDVGQAELELQGTMPVRA